MERLSLYCIFAEKAINRSFLTHHLIMAPRKNQRGKGIRAFQTKNALQRGYGMAVFRGESLQRGHGFGGILKGLLKLALPIIRKSMVKAAPVI